jgi:hypothetical protein
MLVLIDDVETEWKESINDLQTQIVKYNQASEGNNSNESGKEAEKVVNAMKRAGDSHPDPKVQKVWYKRAEEFARGNREEKTTMLEDIGKGLVILIATPFALAGAAIFAAGAIVYGAGSLITGLGKAMTFGVLGKRGGRGR